MKLQTKIWTLSGAVVVLMLAVAAILEYRSLEEQVRKELRMQAHNVYAALMAVRRVYHQQFLSSAIPLNERTLGFLPAHALSRVSREIGHWAKTGLRFNNVSDRPRNPENRADAAEQGVINWFRAHPGEEERTEDFADTDGRRYFHFAAPIRAEAYCLQCHGERGAAPAVIRQNYAEGYGYQVGDLVGIVSIKIPVAEVYTRTVMYWLGAMGRYLLGFGALFLILGLVISSRFSRRVATLETAARRIADGDYAARAAEQGGDEISALAAAFNRMSEAVQQRESAFHDSERNLRRAQSVSSTGSWYLDVRRNNLEWSEETYRIFGMKPGAPLNYEAFLDRVHPEDREKVNLAWRAALHGAPYDIEHRIIVGEAVRWVRERAELEFSPDGSAVRSTGTVQDITERKLLEQSLEEHRSGLEDLVAKRTAELKSAEAQMRLILESSGAGMYGLDMDGRVTFVNPAACAILGYRADELNGEGVHRKIHFARADGTPYPDAECPMLIALHQGRTFSTDKEVFWRADGTPVEVYYSTRPMYEGGRLVGAVVSFNDISAQKAMVRAKEAALEEAERLAQTRSDFLANMSHEIRTPLNAVLGLAQVGLRDSGGSGRPGETFARILDSGQLLLGLINDILDVSKLEAGKLTLERVPVRLGKVIDRAVAVIAARAYEKGLEFVVEESPELPAVCVGDPLRMSQVLINLLSNAVKFTHAGRITLTAKRKNRQLLFRVTDAGIGMPPEQVARLWDAFEQADGSTTRRFGGTGLGLTISRRLVELMGGVIRVESRPGQGSTFEVLLPLQEEAPGTSPPVVHGMTVALARLAETESKALAASLAARGAKPAAVPVEEIFRTSADLAVVCCGSLRDTAIAGAAMAAVEEGRRVAVVCTPGQDDRIPAALRNRVHILERPLRIRHLLEALTAAPATPPPATPPGRRLAGYSILVAEDNELNRLVIEDMLTGEGARVECVENGRLAVEKATAPDAVCYDVVLMDVQMPEMDGYEATRHIRERAPGLPVIGVTAHALPEEHARCRAAGMVESLVKPVETDKLVSVIQRHARHRVPDRQAGEA